MSFLAARLVRGDRPRLRALVPAAAVLVLGGLALAPAATRTLRTARSSFGRADPRGELVVWLREHLEPGGTYVTFVHPPRLSPLSLQVFRGTWTPPESADVQLVPLVDLVRRSPTFADLRAELEQQGSILIAMKTFATVLRKGRTVAEVVAEGLTYSEVIRDSGYGDELGKYLSA